MLSDHLDQIATMSLGEVVIFKWIEFLREHTASSNEKTAVENVEPCVDDIESREDAAADDTSPNILNVNHGLASPEVHEKWNASIVSGDILVDRKSTFQAHLAPVRSVADVADMLSVLKSNNKVARATHNIMAYRIARKEGPVQQCEIPPSSEAVTAGGPL